MLLNKKIIIISVFLVLLLASSSYAQVCEVGRIKQILRKVLYMQFTDPGGNSLTANEIKDLLVFYLKINALNSTVDCSVLGGNSNKAMFDVMNQGGGMQDRIPACADGTKYGECSKIRPAYCYAGAIYQKCGLCGCPTNSVCGKSGKCEPTSQNITCFSDIDCAQSGFAGDYFCSGNYVSRTYANYTCTDRGTIYSKCVITNLTYSLSYCNPTLNQKCVAGESTCKLSVNDSAPTVAIKVTPTTIAKGQVFNVTVTGTDDAGLSAIWWWGVNTNDAELDKAHWFSCNGIRYCANSWLVTTNATGTWTLGANSRDTAYPVAGDPHQASEGAGIAYATLTVTDSGAAPTTSLTIKGRLVDKYTLKPVANVGIHLGTSSTEQALNPIYTNSNGEFAIALDTTTLTLPKMFPYWPKCYEQGYFLLEKKLDGSLNVRLYLFDLVREDKSFAVSGSELNLGGIPLWPAVDIAVNSDIAVQMNIAYPEEGRSYGNINYKTSHYLSNVVPLLYDTKVELKSASGTYTSPAQKYGLENGCSPVTLNFYNGQFSWSGAPATTNTSSFSVVLHSLVVNGSSLEATYTKNFDTCVHLLTSTSSITHTSNYFCTQGSNVKITAPLSSFNAVVGQSYKLCHGNNYNICSELKALTSATADICIDYDNGDNIYTASYAKKGTQAQYDKCGSAEQNYDIIEGVCSNGNLAGIPHSCSTGTKCQNIRYEPAVYANVSACVNVTTTN